MSFNLQPFWEAETAVQVHVISALIAMVVGVVIFVYRKGSPIHKAAGRVWVASMAIVALSSFMIHGLRTIGPLSGLHLLSVWTLGVLVFAIWAIRNGRVEAHKFSLIGLYIGGLVVTGILAFSRDLLMHKIFFGEHGAQFIPSPQQLPGGPVEFAFIAAGLVTLGVLIWAFSGKNLRRRKGTVD